MISGSRGNAAHFSPRMSQPNGLCIKWTLHFVHNRVSAAQFSPRKFRCISILIFGSQKRGKCCPLCSRKFSCKSALHFCRRKCCPFFSKSFLTQIDFFFGGVQLWRKMGCSRNAKSICMKNPWRKVGSIFPSFV